MAEVAPPVITGLGVATALGFGKDALRAGLRDAPPVFGVLAREGRQHPSGDTAFLGAELPELPEAPPRLPPRVARTTGLTGRVAVQVMDEAWREAELDQVDPTRVGLVIGGSNLQARESLRSREKSRKRPGLLTPRYGHTFLDTDLAGLLAECFGVRGFAYTLGGASASGALAIFQAGEAVRSGQVDACVALGALQDLSHFELRGLRSMGAMGSTRFAEAPSEACRPFDADRDGFVFGEGAAALVLRRAEDVGSGSYGSLVGSALVSDAHRGPEPSREGEVRAIQAALHQAGLAPEDIDYVNTHGTGSPLGDDTEVEAYRRAGLAGARFNATKSIVGHGLAAAGAVEVAALLLQVREGWLHPCRNLEDPIAPDIAWVRGAPEERQVRHALKLSLGFGGVNVALAVKAP